MLRVTDPGTRVLLMVIVRKYRKEPVIMISYTAYIHFPETF